MIKASFRDIKKVVNQQSGTKMLIVEIKNLDVNSWFFHDVFTVKFNRTSIHQDAFDDNKHISLFLSKNYKKEQKPEYLWIRRT